MTRIHWTYPVLISIALAGAACGGAQTREERASETAGARADDADQRADRASDVEELVENYDAETIEEANAVYDATPEDPPPEE